MRKVECHRFRTGFSCGVDRQSEHGRVVAQRSIEEMFTMRASGFGNIRRPSLDHEERALQVRGDVGGEVVVGGDVRRV